MSYSGLKDAVTELRIRNSVVYLKHRAGGHSCSLGTKSDLYQLYWMNELVSKEIRFLLSQFEVILRNRINEAYILHYGPDWLLSGMLRFGKDEQTAINEASRRIISVGKHLTHDRVLAKLSLSFWVRLFRTPYRSITERLKDDIFPRNKSRFGLQFLTYQEILDSLTELRNVRNKVSHQEFILDSRYEINKRHLECIGLIKRMSKDYYSLFQSNDNFQIEFNRFREFLRPILAESHMKDFSW